MTGHEFFVGEVRYGGFVSDESFAELRRHCVLATVDVMPIRHSSQVYLGLREGPQTGQWWIFGGRMNAGETYAETATRVLGRELALPAVDGNRLTLLGYYSLYWNINDEIDHALLVGHTYDVSDEEPLPIPEYHSNAKWFDFDDVLTGAFHPCIKQMVADYSTSRPTGRG